MFSGPSCKSIIYSKFIANLKRHRNITAPPLPTRHHGGPALRTRFLPRSLAGPARGRRRSKPGPGRRREVRPAAGRLLVQLPKERRSARCWTRSKKRLPRPVPRLVHMPRLVPMPPAVPRPVPRSTTQRRLLARTRTRSYARSAHAVRQDNWQNLIRSYQPSIRFSRNIRHT